MCPGPFQGFLSLYLPPAEAVLTQCPHCLRRRLEGRVGARGGAEEGTCACPASADLQELPGLQELRLLVLVAEVNHRSWKCYLGQVSWGSHPPPYFLHSLLGVLCERVDLSLAGPLEQFLP